MSTEDPLATTLLLEAGDLPKRKRASRGRSGDIAGATVRLSQASRSPECVVEPVVTVEPLVGWMVSAGVAGRGLEPGGESGEPILGERL